MDDVDDPRSHRSIPLGIGFATEEALAKADGKSHNGRFFFFLATSKIMIRSDTAIFFSEFGCGG